MNYTMNNFNKNDILKQNKFMRFKLLIGIADCESKIEIFKFLLENVKNGKIEEGDINYLPIEYLEIKIKYNTLFIIFKRYVFKGEMYNIKRYYNKISKYSHIMLEAETQHRDEGYLIPRSKTIMNWLEGCKDELRFMTYLFHSGEYIVPEREEIKEELDTILTTKESRTKFCDLIIDTKRDLKDDDELKKTYLELCLLSYSIPE